MKKLFTAALLAITVATSAFAADESKINSVVISSFKQEFQTASSVSWTAGTEYAKATFVMNQQRMEAFYDENGDRIAVSRGISLDELPVKAKRDFARRFEGYTVKEAVEIKFPNEMAYFISGENEKDGVILKVSDRGNVSLYKKTVK